MPTRLTPSPFAAGGGGGVRLGAPGPTYSTSADAALASTPSGRGVAASDESHRGAFGYLSATTWRGGTSYDGADSPLPLGASSRSGGLFGGAGGALASASSGPRLTALPPSEDADGEEAAEATVALMEELW